MTIWHLSRSSTKAIYFSTSTDCFQIIVSHLISLKQSFVYYLIDRLLNGTSTREGQCVPTVGMAQSGKDDHRDTMHYITCVTILIGFNE